MRNKNKKYVLTANIAVASAAMAGMLALTAIRPVGLFGEVVRCLAAPDDGGGGGGGTATVQKYRFLKKAAGHKKDDVVELDEEDAEDLLKAKAIELVEDDDDAEAIADEVVGRVTKKLGDIVEKAMEQASQKLSKARGGPGLNIEVKDRANEENGFGYEQFGEYMRDVMLFSRKSNPKTTEKLAKVIEFDHKVNGKAATTDDPMNTQSAEDGAALIPPTFSDKLFRKTFDESDVLNEIDVYNINGNSIVFPRLKEDSRATGSRYGGVQTFWTAEGNNVNGTRPKFDRLQLTLKKLMALVYVTQEQLDDSGLALEQLLMNVISSELNFAVTDSIFNGNGTGTPLGILNAPALIAVAKESGQANTTVVANNISKMWSRCQARLRATANWYINQDVEPQLDLLSLAIGTGGSTVPMYLQPGGLTGTAPGILKGRPVKPVEFCPTLGTQGDITLFDPKSYCFITKGGIKTAMSMHLRFDYDEMVFKFTFRCDGAPWWPKALTPYKGTNTLSPIVTIAGRP